MCGSPDVTIIKSPYSKLLNQLPGNGVTKYTSNFVTEG